MGIQVVKTTGTAYTPVYKSVLEKIVGGITLAVNRVPAATKELPQGLPLDQSANTVGLYQMVKCAKGIRTTAAATAVSLSPNQFFVVGEFVSKYGGTTQSTITRITNSTNTVWVATERAVGTLATASYVVEVAAVGATANKYQPDCLLGEVVKVREDDLSTVDNPTASAVLRGSVDESRCQFYFTPQHKTQLTERIRFE